MTWQTTGFWLGLLGASALLYAYFRRPDEHKPAGQSLSKTHYALFNLLGAALVGVNCYAQAAWPALGLEVAWMGIAFRDLRTLR